MCDRIIDENERPLGRWFNVEILQRVTIHVSRWLLAERVRLACVPAHATDYRTQVSRMCFFFFVEMSITRLPQRLRGV